jgi:hypothetical protein
MSRRLTPLAAALIAAPLAALASPQSAMDAEGPKNLSGFYDFYELPTSDVSGVGQLGSIACDLLTASLPAIYAGNFLLDCDGEVPHNETAIAVDPRDASHAAAGYHTYVRDVNGNRVISHVVGTVAVTRDGGASWHEVLPPTTPYQFTGDPALAFDSKGTLWFANIADHEGPGGSFTAPSVVVARSTDGGATWTNPVTVAPGRGAVTPGGAAKTVFQDKEWIAVDAGRASPWRDRAYVTWTSFQEVVAGKPSFRSPITTSRSDDGTAWSAPREISGSSPACVAALYGAAYECDLNQDSYPSVAPNGRVYVTFENFNTFAENQILAVRSDDGGRTFSAPSRVATVYDINYPSNVDGRDTLTGCQFRVSSVQNSAADPSDPSGNTAVVVWSDNRHGSPAATNADVFLARTRDGGATWRVYAVDASPNDQFYPWVAVAPDGRVDVGYMDRSWSTGQQTCEYGFTLARATFDAGGAMTIASRQRVDTALSDAGHARWFATCATDGRTRFIGDYNGVAVGPDGSTWTDWTDMRREVANPPSPVRNHGQHAVGDRTP